MLKELKEDLQKISDPEKAKILQKFFKTGPGEYGEGDVFLGIKIPDQRAIVKNYRNLPLDEIQELLDSKIHEHRVVGLLILVDKYEKSDKENKKRFFDFYLKNTSRINNWDLVDITAPKVIGDFLLDKKRDVLYKLSKSDDLWEKRISIISCFMFIRNNDFDDALAISEILLNDKHDLIHKAVGWILREIGKKDLDVEEKFLEKHYKKMPRTMLRYAIEKFEKNKRQGYLKGKI